MVTCFSHHFLEFYRVGCQYSSDQVSLWLNLVHDTVGVNTKLLLASFNTLILTHLQYTRNSTNNIDTTKSLFADDNIATPLHSLATMKLCTVQISIYVYI